MQSRAYGPIETRSRLPADRIPPYEVPHTGEVECHNTDCGHPSGNAIGRRYHGDDVTDALQGPIRLEEFENPAYLSDQLITYIGNKRALLEPLSAVIERLKAQNGRRPLRILDAFSGSGVVSRLLKQHASTIVANDIEAYAAAISRCHLTNHSTVPWPELRDLVAHLNAAVSAARFEPGFIERLYAPEDEVDIRPSDRVFYTRDNARRIDRYRRLLLGLGGQPERLLLGPLLSEASIHANTAGVFKGFYKDRTTGIGSFGGTGRDALGRILGRIELREPVLSRFECDWEVHQEDAGDLVQRIGDFDLAYIDPPYNEHPYGSNYFMLNLIVNYAEPKLVSKISGIPPDWQRSAFNSRTAAAAALTRFISMVDARFIVVSFSSEGFIGPEIMRRILEDRGDVEVIRLPYNTFRGSRNLRARDIHVTEFLFVVTVR